MPDHEAMVRCYTGPMEPTFELFRRYFPDDGTVHQAHAPYRICPLGAHIDHQQGLVTGFALDNGVDLAFSITTNDISIVYSADFPGETAFSLGSIPPKQGNWGDYVRAAAVALLHAGHPLSHGFHGVVSGPIFTGGLSSSAAVILCYVQALALSNGITLPPSRLIAIALDAEHRYIGLHNGALDQSCEVLCRRDHLLVLDTRDGSYRQLAPASQMPPYAFLIVSSGAPRVLGRGYNQRVDEVKSAAYSLLAFAGLPEKPWADTVMRDVPDEAYRTYLDRLPAPFIKRARHYTTEMQRVRDGVEAWKAGDLAAFGRLMTASGRSSIVDWETGCPELVSLYGILKDLPGVYGTRFSGAGFKGCCVALIDPAYRESIEREVRDAYLRRFPQYKDSYASYVCHSDDGTWVR